MNLKRINYFEKLIMLIHEKLNEKQFLIFSSIMVGVTAGLAAVILKWLVHFINSYFVQKLLNRTDSFLLFILMPVIGITITVLVVKYLFNGSLKKGTENILFAIAKKSSILPFSDMFSHIMTSAITVGFGGSLGLESPIVITGSAIGSNYSRTYRLSYKERTLLLAAGAAGGIAGAFNAPIAGILFALEVLLVDISITAFIPLLIASASGALVSKIILNEDQLLHFKNIREFDYHNVPFYVALGLIAGLISLYHVNLFDITGRVFRKIKSDVAKIIVSGLLLAGLLFLFPSLFGEGYSSIKALADMNVSDLFSQGAFGNSDHSLTVLTLLVCGVMLVKALAVGLTLGGGGNGGNFAPSLFIGAHLGFAFAMFMQLLGFDGLPVSNFVLVGMAGTLCGVFHAPLTAIFLIAEITGGYELIIPLMIVSSISLGIVKYYHPDSLDVRRLKKRGTVISEDKDTSILGKIEIDRLIEKDFTVLAPDETLGSIVEKIKISKRNIFPVVSQSTGKLLGVIAMNDIKEEMFNQEMYNKMIARELMEKPEVKIRVSDDVFAIMRKFDESGQWNLPVTDKGAYVGFLSKSTILTTYRSQLLNTL